MVNRNVVSAKLAELAVRVGRVRMHAKKTSDELAKDPDALDLVAFNLMVAVQICADVASHVIADAGWPAASTLADSFSRLHEHGVLSEESARALGRAAGLRNVVAHGYSGVDAKLVHVAGTDGVKDLDRFATEIAAWVSTQR
jgi:uncharacterized protein YutE (UPF0331/DUF86 family)